MVSLLVSGGLSGGCGGSSATSGPDNRGTDEAGSSSTDGGSSSTGATTSAAGSGAAGTAGGGTAGSAAGGDATSAAGGDATSTEGGASGNGAGGETGACAPSQIVFVVSRSGAMFAGLPRAWDPIREASLAALKKVDAVADLGFVAVTGEADACPALAEVAPGPARYSKIKNMYDSLAAPLKGESPFMYGLDRAGELLTGSGKKYIVFVLNGEADYCSDGLPACPTDSVIAHIQKLNQAGVTTLVAAAPALLATGDDERTAAYESALEGYANAGAGLPAKSHDDPTLLNQMCSSTSDSGAMAWREELEANGKPESGTLADYSETSGDATYVALDPSDVSGMTDALSSLLETIATCD